MVATRLLIAWAAGLVVLMLAVEASSATLPEDRADAMYHSYDGGGVEIDGPSILVRKQVADDLSLSANYYVDSITSASIDVVTTASEYTEERTQWTLGGDYLLGDAVLNFGYSNSDENDYEANTFWFGVGQSFFGGLTTLDFGYARGDDDVFRRGDDDFEEEADRRNYHLSVSQVLTRNMLLAVNFEVITDEGYLNNPYRQVRYVDPSNTEFGYSYQQEVYPNTRTSNALGFQLRYHMPYRAVVYGGYRYYDDDWDINAHTLNAGYIHPLDENWTLEFGARYYDQDNADFYSDLFPFEDAQNYLARDKELSTFSDYSFRLGVTYEFPLNRYEWLESGTVNLFYDRIEFDYDNFSDLRGQPDPSVAPGQEPLYSFSADVLQLFVSVWF